jgi:hypothetical protein
VTADPHIRTSASTTKVKKVKMRKHTKRRKLRK